MTKKLPNDVVNKFNDKEWLHSQYHTELKSKQEIADENGVSRSFVTKQMKRYQVKSRKPNETYLLRREDDGFHLENMDVINGSLLGDAGIYLGDESILPRFAKTNEHYDHVLHVAKKLFKVNPEDRISPVQKGKYWHVSSLGHEELISIHQKWYENINGKFVKHVPKDIILTPNTILHWFLDDGSSVYLKNRTEKCLIRLHTLSFTKEDNQILANQLKKFGIETNISKSVNDDPDSVTFGKIYWQLSICQWHNQKFFDLIGPCPHDITKMSYKWKNITTYEIKYKEVFDREWMYQQLIIEKKTPEQIQAETGIDARRIRMMADWHKIDRPKRKRDSSKTKRNPFLADAIWLKQKHLIENLGPTAIAKLAGCTDCAVINALEKLGIRRRYNKRPLPSSS